MSTGPFQPSGNNQPQPNPYNGPHYPYQPGQFQPPGYNPPPPPYPHPQPHDYGGWTLAFLLIGYLAALIMCVVDVSVMDGVSTNSAAVDTTTVSSNAPFGMVTVFGAVLLIVLHVIVFIKDGRTFATLFGKIQWRRMNLLLTIGLFIIYLCGWIMFPIYLVMAIRYHLRDTQRTLGQVIHSGWMGYREKKRATQFELVGLSVLLILSLPSLSCTSRMYSGSTLVINHS